MAGRRKGTGHYGEPTKLVRVPESKVDGVRYYFETGINPFAQPTCPLISVNYKGGTQTKSACPKPTDGR
jgi:hypothetical protein